MKNNEKLRSRAKERGVRLWQIAEAIGIRPNDFSIMLRHELSDEIQKKAIAAIDVIAEGGEKK